MLPFNVLLPFGIFGNGLECFMVNFNNYYNTLWQFHDKMLEDFILY
jgi:hypothetical protein